VCILTAQPIDPNSIELSAVLEKPGQKVASTRALPVLLNRVLEISFGTVHVELTPQIK
jgi:hypothetical protein